MNQDESEVGQRTISLVLFKAGGFGFGAPAGQVSRTIKRKIQTDDIYGPVPWEISPEEGEKIILITHTKGKKEVMVPVDEVEEIVEARLEEISPFPEIIEPLLVSKGLWGVFFRGGHLFLLMDFFKDQHIA
jgi:hypothetical protein